MDNFKNFLLNEQKSYLGHRVGDVLTSLQDLNNDIENMGSRHLSRLAEEIVNQIRKILHSNWSPKYINNLKELQKIGVAIQRTIDDRGDLKEVLPAAAQALQELSAKLGVKVNNLEAPESIEDTGEAIQPQDFQATGPMPNFGKQEPQMPPEQSQMPPEQPQM